MLAAKTKDASDTAPESPLTLDIRSIWKPPVLAEETVRLGAQAMDETPSSSGSCYTMVLASYLGRRGIATS
ncbi:MAG: hypothetical protein JRN21_06605 [Nitrososphaerota archaeon]|nr:hypothetical protein [Nitrososphaerota archaeon]